MRIDDTNVPGAGATTARIGDPVTTEYLAGLRSALADLPPAEVEDIVEETRGHLAELSEDLGREYSRPAVHERLGAPHFYAAELRTAAGYPRSRESEPRHRIAAGFGVAALVLATVVLGVAGLRSATVATSTKVGLCVAIVLAGIGVLCVRADGPRLPSVAALGGVASLRARVAAARVDGGVGAFVVSLQPAWWVLRALVAAGMTGTFVVGTGPSGLLMSMLLVLFTVPLSVWLGGRSRADRRILWAVVPLNALASGVLLSVVVELAGPDPSIDPYPMSPGEGTGLTLDGSTVQDIRPFDARGRALSGVYLFDEAGRPLAVRDMPCTDARSDAETGSGGDVVPEPGAGDPQVGEPGPYPRGTLTTDPQTGRCITVPPHPMTVTIPQAPANPAPRSGG
ncbi:DUF1700 domain-containing protein [Pseudonocardia phyllosphaerae]|uniref:DUF1700 domain-containing protein n=1 Tax=Pseudonocardia phyllosphaerae TaxID=3390502 RepID=UPI00397C2E22